MLWEVFLVKILEICLSWLGFHGFWVGFGSLSLHLLSLILMEGRKDDLPPRCCWYHRRVVPFWDSCVAVVTPLILLRPMSRLRPSAWKSQNECKYVFLILQVLIKETAPLKKDVNLSNDLHYHIIIIQLSISSGLKRASQFPYLHVLSLKSPTFSSSTTELISQWGWYEIHIFLFRWHNPLWPSAVLYDYISQESVSSG